MKVEKKVIKFLMDEGFRQEKVYFKDLAMAVSLVKKDGTNLSGIYGEISKQTNQRLNTVTYHFHRAFAFARDKLGYKCESPQEMISNLVKEYWYGKPEDRQEEETA